MTHPTPSTAAPTADPATTPHGKGADASPWSLQIARVAGIPVRLHITFWLLPIYVWWAASATGRGAAMQVALVFGVFACIVLHELGHVLTARRYGIGTKSITLYPIGGVSAMESTGKPRQEVWISLAGPLVSLLIGFGLWAGLAWAGPGLRWTLLGSGEATYLEWLAVANLALAAFNLLPAFPMDGGRTLRSLLALRLPKARATAIAGRIGQGFAVVLGLLGLLGGGLVLVLIAFFLFFGAQAEVRLESVRQAASGRTVREAMVTEAMRLAADDTVADAADRLLRTEQHAFPVVEEGRLVGMLTRRRLIEAVSEQQEGDAISEVMEAAPEPVAPGDDLQAVVERLVREGQPSLVPVVEDGELRGILTWDNLMEFVALSEARAQQREA